MSNNSNRKDYAKLIHLNIYITRGFKYDDKALLGLFAHNGEIQICCGQILKENLSQINGKGGGNNKSAQASFETTEDMNRFFDYLKQLLLFEQSNGSACLE